MNFLKTLAGLAFSSILFNSCAQPQTKMEATKSLYDITINSLEGEAINLKDFEGKHILFVNVASKCGFTPQYKDLQELHKKYKDELVIIGVHVISLENKNQETLKKYKPFAAKIMVLNS
jgi:glutathione peroxidase